MHPKTDRAKAPLYVVLHSAGHDVFSCVNCTKTAGNHDIYRSPDDHYALYVDCRKNMGDWWWGGMHSGDKGLIARNSAKIMETNDLIDSFDWLSVRKDEAYPVFTNASTNSQLPWQDNLDSAESGQINAFFRWKTLKDTADEVEISLFLIPASKLETRFEIPTEASTDTTRRTPAGQRQGLATRSRQAPRSRAPVRVADRRLDPQRLFPERRQSAGREGLHRYS